MLISRRPDGGLLFEIRWDQWVTEWKAAPDAKRVVLEDGRPAVRREPDEDELGDVTYTTLPHELWRLIKTRQREAFALTPPPPRTRLCQACRGEMKVAREYENVWTFSCPHCRSVETWGKNLVGGTRGAGEVEKK